MAEIIKKKLINEYDRCAYNVDAEGNPILDDPKFTDANNFIPEIAEDKQNAYIDPQELITKSIDGILTDPENRTLWINGMPYGNAYVADVNPETGPFHAEIFNDYETNKIDNEAHYSHVEGRHNSISGASEGSHVEGGSADKGNVVTDSKYVHVEGRNNHVLNNADYSHTEGDSNYNNAVGAHIEGYKNTANNTALYSHIDGAYNITYNPYEHAQGISNWSQHYLAENGGDEQNYNNQIVATIGVGNETGTRKNALRVNKDGAVYLGAVTKVTDRVVETFNPCNYNGESIYSVNQVNTEKKELVSKSVQELLTDINHMESVTYWKLRNLANSKKLLPGKTYRITDYKPGLNSAYLGKYDEETQSGNISLTDMPRCILSSHVITRQPDNKYKLIEDNNNLNRFDICVTAVSESEVSDNAKIVAHDYFISDVKYNYFNNTNFNAWTVKYNFTGDDKLYDWVNTTVTEPKIRIRVPANIASYAGEKWFDSIDSLTASGLFENDSLKSVIYYSGTDDYSYFKLKHNIQANDDDYAPVTFDSTEYSYAESYYYTSDVEKQWKNNGSDMTAEVHPTIPNIHTYNYKWLLNMVGDPKKKLFEYCLLTNESDFSYMKNNGNEQLTNILLCKNDRKIAITQCDGSVDEKTGNTKDNYYNLPNSKPYVIEVKSKNPNQLNTESEYVYNAYIYGGEFNGWYGEEPDSGFDIWYILNDYNPQDGIYNVYKDTVGVKLFLVKRELNGGTPDFNNFNSSLQEFMKSADANGLLTYELKQQPVFLGNNKDDLSSGVTVAGEGNTLTITITEKGKNEYGNEDDFEETYKLRKDGENYLTYNYKGIEYYVWAPQHEQGSNRVSFLISNNVVNGIPTKPEDITNLHRIYLPAQTDFEIADDGTKILEYNIINITPKDGNKIEVDGESMEFIGGDFNRNTTKLEYQNERYYIPFYPSNASLSKQYRVLAEYTLNLEYELNNPKSLSENLNFEYFTETCLIPITYVTLDTGINYYEDGKYESTGVIYRMIDEYGNDCPYDFKNIKFFTGDITNENLMLSYAYTFDGVIIGEEQELDENGKPKFDEDTDMPIMKPIENPYLDINNIGDKSLTGSCINNIIETDLNTIPNICFRLSFLSTFVNNKFINCNNIGSKVPADEPGNSYGNNTQLSNNVFNNCKDLYINHYNTMNSFFYNCGGTFNGIYNTPSIITNSTFIDTTFADSETSSNCINILNSQIYSSENLDITDSYTVSNSIIYNGTLDKETLGKNNMFALTNINGLNINQNYHTINALNNSGFSIENSGQLSLLSDKDTYINPNDGLVVIKPTQTSRSVESPKTTFSKKTQTFNYPSTMYGSDLVSKSRDNGTASGKTIYYTFYFNKNEAQRNSWKSGSDYTFIEAYPYKESDLAIADSRPDTAYFKLGTFFVQHYWNMYTWAGQSNAVEGKGTFTIDVQITLANEDGTAGTTQPSIKFSTSKLYGGYWSKKTWGTKYIYSYINFDRMTNTDFGLSEELYTSLGFLISKSGSLKIYSIKLTISGSTYANSTGANNCIGDVFISNLYHTNNTSYNSTFSSTKGTIQGSVSSNFANPTINYYTASRYQKDGTATGNMWFTFAKDGIIFHKNEDDAGGTKLYIDTQGNLIWDGTKLN